MIERTKQAGSTWRLRAYAQPPQASDHGVNFLTPSMSFGLDILLELLLDPYTCTDTHSEQC